MDKGPKHSQYLAAVTSKLLELLNVTKRNINARTKIGSHFLTVEWAVTYLCNSRCIYCNIWKIPKDRIRKELKTEQIIKILQRDGKYIYRLSITGGEPFLKQNIEKIIIEAFNQGIKKIDIVTNAVLPSIVINKLKLIDYNLRKNIVVSVSLDGVEEVHDKIRGIKGNFKNAIRLIQWLRDNGFNVGISITIGNLNADSIIPLLKYIEQLGLINSVSIRIAAEAKFYNNIGKISINKDKIKQILYEIFAHYPHLARNRFIHGNLLFLENKIDFNCVAGRNFLFVDPYGNVYPCLYRTDVKLGNIVNESIIRMIGKFKRDCYCWSDCHYLAAVEHSPIEYIRFYLFKLKHK